MVSPKWASEAGASIPAAAADEPLPAAASTIVTVSPAAAIRHPIDSPMAPPPTTTTSRASGAMSAYRVAELSPEAPPRQGSAAGLERTPAELVVYM